jgi:hypothetical protein
MAKRFIKSSKIDAEITRDGMVYVYEAPVRAWHWINAAAIVGLFLTGYLIGSPPPALTGSLRRTTCSAGSVSSTLPAARSWRWGSCSGSTGASWATISRGKSSGRRFLAQVLARGLA